MSNTNDKKGGRYAILVMLGVIALIAMACGFFYANDRSKKDVLDNKPGDAPKEISLLDESTEAQRVLDTILLQKDNWQLIENDHGKKEVEVEESGAKVKINQRELAVGVPVTTSVTGAGEWLKEKVEAAGLVYIDGDMTTYKKWDAFKAQVGIKVKAGEGTKNFLTDTIVFFHNGNLVKEDKDVKDLPEEPVKEKEEKQVPARQYKGKLAIVIDDCGADTASVRTLLDTGLPFSYAIIPYKQYSTTVLGMIQSAGRVPMLHLPMEPMNRSAMSEGKRAITVDMSADAQVKMAREALNSLPGVKGVNNHQGSRATSDQKTMDNVLKELKRQGVFFVDSNTIGSSVARATASRMGIPTARNDIFLDNSTDVEQIRAQVYKAMAMAEKNGSAIAICHARVNTAAMWKKYAAEFRKTGITFVPVTELLY